MASVYFWELSGRCKRTPDWYLRLFTVRLGWFTQEISLRLWTTQTRAGPTFGTSRGQLVSLGTEQRSTNGPLRILNSAHCCSAWRPCEPIYQKGSGGLEKPRMMQRGCNSPMSIPQVVAFFFCFFNACLSDCLLRSCICCLGIRMQVLRKCAKLLLGLVCMNQCSYRRVAESRRECHLFRCCLFTCCIPTQAHHCSRERAQKRRAFAHLAMSLRLEWLFHWRVVKPTLGFHSQTCYRDLPR